MSIAVVQAFPLQETILIFSAYKDPLGLLGVDAQVCSFLQLFQALYLQHLL